MIDQIACFKFGNAWLSIANLLASCHITSQQVSPWQNNLTLPFLPILRHTGDKVKSIHHLLHLSMPQLWISVCYQEAIWWWWALLCNCYGVQGCLKVPIDLDFICRRMCRTLSRRADNSEPQIAVPDFGEWLIDFRKFCFCKMLGFCKVAWGSFGSSGISSVYRYWEIFATYNELWCCLSALRPREGIRSTKGKFTKILW